MMSAYDISKHDLDRAFFDPTSPAYDPRKVESTRMHPDTVPSDTCRLYRRFYLATFLQLSRRGLLSVDAVKSSILMILADRYETSEAMNLLLEPDEMVRGPWLHLDRGSSSDRCRVHLIALRKDDLICSVGSWGNRSGRYNALTTKGVARVESISVDCSTMNNHIILSNECVDRCLDSLYRRALGGTKHWTDPNRDRDHPYWDLNSLATDHRIRVRR